MDESKVIKLLTAMEKSKRKEVSECQNPEIRAGLELQADMYRDFIVLLTNLEWLDRMYERYCGEEQK